MAQRERLRRAQELYRDQDYTREQFERVKSACLRVLKALAPSALDACAAKLAPEKQKRPPVSLRAVSETYSALGRPRVVAQAGDLLLGQGLDVTRQTSDLAPDFP